MNRTGIGLLSLLLIGACVFSKPLAAAATAPTNSAALPAAQDPALDQELRKIMADDDAAQAEVDEWIRNPAKSPNAGLDPRATLKLRILQRFEPVRKSYKEFIDRHPDHAKARLAYGSFLNDLGEEAEAVVEWEKSRELDPSNPAAWNNLANHYGHYGQLKKAFEFYTKAIELNPAEPTYLQNLATIVYLYRKDAQEYYGISEDKVFDKSLDLYRKAIRLDPTNFALASDYAQSFYGTKPPRLKEGLVAWEEALKVAEDEVQRQGVYIHLARIKWKLGRLDEARKHLSAVTDPMYKTLKTRLLKNIEEDAKPASKQSVPKDGAQK